MPGNSRQLPFTISIPDTSQPGQPMKCSFCHPPKASPKNSLVHLRSWLVCCFGCFGGVQVTFQLCLDHLAEKQRAAQPRTAQRCAHHVSIYILAPSAEVFCPSRRSFYPTPETRASFVAETYACVRSAQVAAKTLSKFNQSF